MNDKIHRLKTPIFDIDMDHDTVPVGPVLLDEKGGRAGGAAQMPANIRPDPDGTEGQTLGAHLLAEAGPPQRLQRVVADMIDKAGRIIGMYIGLVIKDPMFIEGAPAGNFINRVFFSAK